MRVYLPRPRGVRRLFPTHVRERAEVVGDRGAGNAASTMVHGSPWCLRRFYACALWAARRGWHNVVHAGGGVGYYTAMHGASRGSVRPGERDRRSSRLLPARAEADLALSMPECLGPFQYLSETARACASRNRVSLSSSADVDARRDLFPGRSHARLDRLQRRRPADPSAYYGRKDHRPRARGNMRLWAAVLPDPARGR